MSFEVKMKALADPVRLEIINLLKDGEMSAGNIASHFSVSQPSVSRHLSILKSANIICSKHIGNYILYELNDSSMDEIILWLEDFLYND